MPGETYFSTELSLREPPLCPFRYAFTVNGKRIVLVCLHAKDHPVKVRHHFVTKDDIVLSGPYELRWFQDEIKELEKYISATSNVKYMVKPDLRQTAFNRLKIPKEKEMVQPDNKVLTAIRFSKEIHEALKLKAEKEDRSMSGIVRLAVKEYLEK